MRLWLLAVLCVLAPSQPSEALTFSITPDTALSSDTDALNAFTRGADQWGTLFTDDITIEIDAQWQTLGGSVIGSASSTQYSVDYDTIRDRMASDASDESDDNIVTYLPTSSELSVTLDGGDSLASPSKIIINKATLKALGYIDTTDTSDADYLNIDWSLTDATLTFNSSYSFDFDNTDGVTAGLMDFETVVAHEIGHALGFTSKVDVFDTSSGITSSSPSPLDLFRFTSGSLPTDESSFTTTARDMTPGSTTYFSDTEYSYLFSTGSSEGDGQQASHWKDGQDPVLGIMDPTLSSGELVEITSADLRALDVIGYDIILYATPLPDSAGLMLVALGLMFLYQRKHTSTAKTT
ncbi:MAG: NF038122 family metalloprotease [Magnetococcales bacterium]|nr:NF038122 family metalloprotease [Magnetococcales bacterium]